MVVIADTSPLNYLILIGHVDVLKELYGEVVIPRAVLVELRHPTAPAAGRSALDRIPSALDGREPGHPATA